MRAAYVRLVRPERAADDHFRSARWPNPYSWVITATLLAMTVTTPSGLDHRGPGDGAAVDADLHSAGDRLEPVPSGDDAQGVLQEFGQLLEEPRGGGAVDSAVIGGEGDAQDAAGDDLGVVEA